ncbi:MAG: hypothetical protein ACJ75B_13055 [Flavisolibacter sp.]|jgi:hypothetical protein
MKKQFLNRIQKTIVSVVLASALLGVSPLVHAADGTKAPASSVAVTYVGSIENQPVFQIDYDNKDEAVFVLTIKDSDGNTLYVEKSKDKKFSKKFRYDGDEHVKLTFIIATPTERLSQSFEVNTNTRVVQDVVVTKL